MRARCVFNGEHAPLTGLTASHCSLPQGIQCRSWRAGGTGVLMALPGLIAPAPDRYLWFIQGILSVWCGISILSTPRALLHPFRHCALANT